MCVRFRGLFYLRFQDIFVGESKLLEQPLIVKSNNILEFVDAVKMVVEHAYFLTLIDKRRTALHIAHSGEHFAAFVAEFSLP